MAKATPRRRSAGKAAPNNLVAMPTAPARKHAEVAKRAYEIFLARGGKHGLDLEDWLTAERELKHAAD